MGEPERLPKDQAILFAARAVAYRTVLAVEARRRRDAARDALDLAEEELDLAAQAADGARLALCQAADPRPIMGEASERRPGVRPGHRIRTVTCDGCGQQYDPWTSTGKHATCLPLPGLDPPAAFPCPVAECPGHPTELAVTAHGAAATVDRDILGDSTKSVSGHTFSRADWIVNARVRCGSCGLEAEDCRSPGQGFVKACEGKRGGGA